MRYVSFTIDGITGAARDAILESVHEFNTRSATTKVTLVSDDAWWGVDIRFEANSSLTSPACAAADSNSDTVYLNPTLISAAADHPGQVQYAIGHEVGHVLGLDHGPLDGDSIMSVPSNWECTSANIASWPQNMFGPDDASSAASCIQAATDPNHEFPSTTPYTQESEWYYDDPPYTCYHVWYVTTVWKIDAQGFYYVYSRTWDYLGVLCVEG